VEDNVVMREMIKRMVGDLADEISECEDGNQALAAYETSHPDCVLMDLEMPGMGWHHRDPEPDQNPSRGKSHHCDRLRRQTAARGGASSRRVRLRVEREPD
jgi:CheY-like chemotaxis protein